MAKYLGPTHRLCRREGMSLCDSPKCPARGKRKYPPGQHGLKGGYPQGSIYNKQLRAKQRVKRFYGLLERQFRITFEKAQKAAGNTAENMLKLLEKRLDNVVYRLGFADTRLQARQMVSHQHILVNGKKNSIPSYIVRIEDEIALSPSAIKTKLFQEKLSNMVQKERPAWLAWFETEGKQSGKIVSEHEVSDIVSLLEPQRIVELYSK